MATQTAVFEHPSIGQIHGTKPDNLPHVEQYLGIQYAKLANRLARGTPIETYSTPVQATHISPLPIADPKNCDGEHLFLLQHALPHPEYTFSDTECLTLNVSVPSLGARADIAGLLPVVVFVHGGGFVTGSANWPQWELARLVEKSVGYGKPVIAVGINYRLGPLGFVTSSALRDAGFKPNNGLDDQKLGLRWVQKNISGFGGDPSRVTFLGSSMGAASGLIHLHSPEPLFNQLVGLGGNPMLQPFPQEVAEHAYNLLMAALGLDALPPPEQVQALLSMPTADLQAKLSTAPIPISSVIDDDIVPAATTYATLADPQSTRALYPGTHWCKSILLGDGQHDGMVIMLMALSSRTDDLPAALKSHLAAALPDDPAIADALVARYGVGSDPDAVLHLVNDAIFAQGTTAAARAWARCGGGGSAEVDGNRAFLARFNMPNPWAGDWRGRATHALDMAVLLGNYNEFLGRGQRACSGRMAEGLLAFAYGGEPFPVYSGGTEDGVSMLYYAGVGDEDDGSGVVREADRAGTGRRGILEEVAGGRPEVLDKVLLAVGMLLQGPK